MGGGKDFLKNKITPSTSSVTWLPPLRRHIWNCQCCQLWVGKISLRRHIWNSQCCQLWVGKISLRRHIWNCQFSQLWVVKMSHSCQLWEVKIPLRRRDCCSNVGKNSVVIFEKKNGSRQSVGKRREIVCRYVWRHFSDRWGRPDILGRAKIEFERVASKRVD